MSRISSSRTKGGKKRKRKGRFSGLGGKKGTQESLYHQPGHYIGMVEKVEADSRASDGADFTAIRVTVLHAFDDGEQFQIPNSDKFLPHHKPGESPANVLMDGKFGTDENWMNFLQVAAGITEADAEELAGRLHEAVQKEEDLEKDEDLADYADFADDIESFEDALDVVWEVASEQAISDEQPLAGALVEWVSNMRLKKDSRAKDTDKLTLKDDYYTRTVYRRRVPAAEVAELVDEKILARFIPNIEDRVAAEAEEAEGDED